MSDVTEIKEETTPAEIPDAPLNPIDDGIVVPLGAED